MSTNARIGIENEDGSIDSIYLHWDGYAKHGAGETLRDHYNTESQVRELIALGDISSLGDTLALYKDFDYGWHNPDNLSQDEMIHYEATHTCPYSVRGEYCPAEHSTDEEDYKSLEEEYTYLFKKGSWLCKSHYTDHQFNFINRAIVCDFG